MGFDYRNPILYKYTPSPGQTEIVIPPSTREIRDRALENCTEITDVILPEGLRIIGSSAFAGCTSLTQIRFPYSLTEILEFAFYGCTALREISIPPGVRQVGRFAFGECTGAKRLRIASTRTILRSGAIPAPLLVDAYITAGTAPIRAFLQSTYALTLYRLIDGNDAEHLAALLSRKELSVPELQTREEWMNMLGYASNQEAIAAEMVLIRYIKENYPSDSDTLRL